MLVAAQLLWGIGFGLMAPIFPLYLAELGAGGAEIGIVFGVGNLAAAAAMLPAGAAADRFGRRRLLLLAGLMGALGAFALLPLTSWHGAVVGSVLYWSGTVGLPIMAAHVAATTPRPYVGRAMGMVFGAFFVGNIVAAPLSGALASAAGFRAAIAAGGIAILLSAAAITLLRTTARPAAGDARRLPRAFWVLMGLTPLAAFVAVLPVPLLPVYLREVAAIPLERVGLHVGLFSLGAALLSVASGRLADRAGPVAAVIAAATLLVVASATLVLTAGAEPLVGLGTLLLGANVAANPVLAAALERVLPPSRAALGYAAFQLCYGLGFGTGGILAGALYDTDVRLPFLVTAAVALPVAAIVSLAVARLGGSNDRVARLESAGQSEI